ncbi:hypothetical protein C0Q70_04008 [Pomacea canaliculata]|uniref:Reverse transcriptase domain-containing protein n=1 Tax=Pomacea canaliculata TaxID=400727 RepID=A0A2T7PUB1_POMCA|nr:hypothetical protein C0Q70_04008 [Pomacea canaliculata]
MCRTTQDNNTGIHWTFIKQLDFADDISLLSHWQQHAQIKLSKLAEVVEKTGLKVNRKKTELMRTNNKQELPIQLQGESIKETDPFMYLGSTVNKDGGADDDIKIPIKASSQLYILLLAVFLDMLKSALRLWRSASKATTVNGDMAKRLNSGQATPAQASSFRCMADATRSGSALEASTNSTKVTFLL